MRTARVSEVFASIQGEGLHSGIPSIFVRLFGCTMTCMGFSNPAPRDEFGRYPELPGPPESARTVADLNGDDFTVGCDTRYSWDARFKHLSPVRTALELAEQIAALAKAEDIRHIVWTGGEPLMHVNYISDVIALLDHTGITNITFETNGSIIINPGASQDLRDWVVADYHRHILFSNSPKLSHSGEHVDKRCNPLAFRAQAEIARQAPGQVSQTCKYVVDATDADFTEAMRMHYHLAQGVDAHITWEEATWRFPILAMPLGADNAQYESRKRAVAKLAQHYGFRFCPRLHLELFGNAVGT